MAIHLVVFVFLLVVGLILSLARLGRLDWFPLRPASSQGATKRTRLHRLLKPRTPGDCPACRLASPASSSGEPAHAPVRPWREVKSRRGAPKRVNTEGFACPNPQCPYFGSTDAHHHALVGDGKHGRAEQIQTFRCQACRTTFTSRRNTPLYRLKTPSQQVAMVRISARRRAGPFGGLAGLWLLSGHHHEVADSCWQARPDVARALLQPSAPPTHPTGRTPHPAALRQRGAVVVAGHRCSHQDSSSAPARSPHATHGPPRDPLPTTEPSSWLHPTFH